MFCPKCGQQNPDNSKYCRNCGTDLGGVTNALSGRPQQQMLLNHKGRPVTFEGAITKLFSGLAFLVAAIVLATTGALGGHGWWFWLLFPAFGSISPGVAQLIQLRRFEKNRELYGATTTSPAFQPQPDQALPPAQTQWPVPDPRYKTGDLVPPSVTDNTTRHLDIDAEGKTMTLPKE